MFLQRKDGRQVSFRTLKKRLNTYGLNRRNVQYDIESVRKAIENLVNGGHGNLNGYRAVCRTPFQLNGVRVPRTVVQLPLREILRELMKEKHSNRDLSEVLIEIQGITTSVIAMATINLNPTVFLFMVVLIVGVERSCGCTYNPLKHLTK